MNNSMFEIYIDRAGYYRWRLIAKNNEKVAASEAYVSKQNAIKSVKNVKILAWQADIVDSTN